MSEPRRSVRATKGQHTKSFDDIEQLAAPKRRRTKKTQKAQDESTEFIRCVCGATEQDNDSGEAWIGCETCEAWQHNVCVGVSSFEDEIPDEYYCERCKPEDHEELLAGMAKGEKPWEERRRKHEEEEAEPKRKKRGKGKGGKRNSDAKDEESDKDHKKNKGPPAAEEKDKKEAVSRGKRKSRDPESQDTDKAPKQRRLSEEAVTDSKYTTPEDMAQAISELPTTRSGPAKALKKSLSHVLASLHKSNDMKLAKDDTIDAMAERLALQIERAVFDTHPMTKAQKEYTQQIKSLSFNLKNNPEICQGLLANVHSPSTLAVMTSDQLASAEMQKQTAEMRARAEKQSILYTSDTGPRVRRTHKGEELVEDESQTPADVPPPMPGGSGFSRRKTPQDAQVKRESIGGDQADLSARPKSRDASTEQRSPSQSNFDIGKVFSTVKSSSPGMAPRRPSAPVIKTNGPGIDPEVDRMLEDETDSPPYSPTDENADPDVIWRGHVAMNSVASFNATAKHVGGFNFAAHGSWSKLIPKRMTVAGRISQQSAIEYLCSMRYSHITDVIVVSLEPSTPELKDEFHNLISYFIPKNRYGVVGDKVEGNVRDTYLVPVPPGEDGHPEFMLNLVDNKIPKSRTEPMLLAVFVYRSDPEQVRQSQAATILSGQHDASASPSLGRQGSLSGGPTFSPATPQQGAFTTTSSQTPVPIPQPPGSRPANAPQPPNQPMPQSRQPAPAAQANAGTRTVASHTQQATPGNVDEAKRYADQQAGEALAQQVLGDLFRAPTVRFLMSQAYHMVQKEWELVKDILEKDPKARDDLGHLGALIEKRSREASTARQNEQAQQAQQAQQKSQGQAAAQAQAQVQ